jgi:hypothetical protein
MYDDTLEVTEEVTTEKQDGTALLDLEHWQCRFPIGQSSVMLFCGKPRRDLRSSFCSHHHTVAWVKARSR